MPTLGSRLPESRRPAALTTLRSTPQTKAARPPRKLRVCVSSTYEDLKDFRAKVNHGKWLDVCRAVVLAAVISAFFASSGVGLLYFLDIGSYFKAVATRPVHIQGGAMIGFVVLVVLGLLFGLTIRLHGRKRTNPGERL